MGSDKKDAGFAALFYPSAGKELAMYVSTPPPVWLGERDLSRIVINAPGMYCVFFIISAKADGRAYITVNGREIYGSYAKSQEGKISGSAICSIRKNAIPCSLSVSTKGECDGGIFIVMKYEI